MSMMMGTADAAAWWLSSSGPKWALFCAIAVMSKSYKVAPVTNLHCGVRSVVEHTRRSSREITTAAGGGGGRNKSHGKARGVTVVTIGSSLLREEAGSDGNIYGTAAPWGRGDSDKAEAASDSRGSSPTIG